MLNRGVVVVVAVLAASCQPEQRPMDACAGVLCGAGQCAVLNGAPACLCDEGYRAVGLSCAAIPPADLCASRPCEGLSNSLCLVGEGTVRCTCPEGRVAIGGSCVVKTACTPNPCTAARRSTCEVVAGAAECRCDPGYAPDGTGCAVIPVWTCAAQHSGDGFEPDECPSLAPQTSSDQPEQHTVFPAGDHDWFSVGAPAGRLLRFDAVGMNLSLLVEAFDASGTTVLASDNRGANEAGVTFIVPASGRVMVRVRALRASDTGDYVATLTSLGTDDYTNVVDDAVTLVPAPAGFTGEVQYANDLDVVKLELPARTAVRLERPDSGVLGLVIEVAREDGGTRVLEHGERSVLTVPAVETVRLTARGRNPRNVGRFELALEELGPDDHAEEAIFATLLAPGPSPTSGVFERPTDIDGFRIDQQVGRLYALTWTTGPSSSISGTLFDSNNAVLVNQSGSLSGQSIVWQAVRSTPATLRLQPYYLSSSGTYSVALEDLGFDDHSNELGNATPLTVGMTASGRLELVNDVDTFSFTAVAGRVMVASVAPAVGGPTYLHLRLYAPDGSLAGEADGSVGVLAASTGTYKVQVSRNYSSTSFLASYQLTVTDSGPDDHGNLRANATPLTVGTTATGSVQYATDLDVFSFPTVAGRVYGVTCTRTQGTCAFRVFDGSGQVVPGASNSGAFLATTAGTWAVEISGGGSSSALGPFTLVVSDLGAEDHGATPATATAATLGSPVTGRLDFSGDVDVFSFPGVADRIYRATVTGVSSTNLEVRTAANTVVASGTYSSALSFIAPTTGTLSVALSSYSSYAPASAYSLTIEDLGTDDHGGTVATATPLTLGASTAGSVQYRGDVDLFTVAVTPGHHHRVQCTARLGSCGISVEAGSTTLASVYASSNATTAFNPPSTVSSVVVRITSSGDTASYELTVSDVGADDHGDTLADATTLVLDAVATAGALPIETDVDVFKLTIASGEIVSFTCTTTAGNACGLTVIGPLGTLSTVSAGAVTSTAIQAGTSGTYRVEVRAGYLAQASAYTIAAARGQDDVTTLTPLTLGAQRSGALDYVGDTDVFSLALTAGVSVRVTTTGAARVQVYSPTNTYVANVYSGSSSQFTPSVTGTYTFTASADYSSRPVGAYTLTVQ